MPFFGKEIQISISDFITGHLLFSIQQPGQKLLTYDFRGKSRRLSTRDKSAASILAEKWYQSTSAQGKQPF
jgi:hypothetical protein